MSARSTAAVTRSPTRVLLASSGGTFAVTFDGAALQMVLPAIRRQLHVGVWGVVWTMTAYLLVMTVAYLPTGRLGDLYGRDRVWGWGVYWFIAASLGCSAAVSLTWLVVARALQGLGAAAITANSAPLLLEAYPPERRARALAFGAVAIGLGLLLGPAVGALLTRSVSWRLLFVLAVPFGATCYLIGRKHLPHNRGGKRRFDVVGAISGGLGLGALVVGASSGRHLGWLTWPTLLLLCGGFALTVLFVLLDRRRPEPLLDLALFGHRSFVSGTVASLFAYAALFVGTTTMPFFLIEVQQRGLVASGLLIAVVPVALALTAPLAGWLADRVGSRWVCTSGLAAICTGLILAIWLPAAGGLGLIVTALVVVGVGVGAFEAPNSADALGSVEPENLGVGSATMGLMRNFGMTIGAALASVLLGTGASVHGAVERSSERWAFFAGASSAGLGTIVAALRPSRSRRR